MNTRAVALPLLAAAVAVGIWWTTSPPGPGNAPAATWRLGAPDDYEQAQNYAEAPADTPLRLSYNSPTPRHVYVFSRSAEDGTLLMHPSPDVRGAPPNPLPAGQTVLPGARDDAPLQWTTRAEILATTAYVVVAAEQPVDELEALLPRMRRWTNTALTDGAMAVTKPAGVAELAGAPRTDWPSAILARAADRAVTETIVNGPLHPDEQLAGVWSAAFFLKEAPGTKKKDPKDVLQPKPDGK